MEIFVLRHGDANVITKKLLDDSKRTLSDKGVKEIEDVSELFSKLDMKFDYIYSSPLKRARQSAEILLRSQKKSKLVELNELKPEGTPETISDKLSEQKEESSVIIIGHNPLLIDFISYVTASEHCHLSLKTGGIAKIKTTSMKPRLSGNLELLLTPKLIRKVRK
jgi:phosphohistidine phosphatase